KSAHTLRERRTAVATGRRSGARDEAHPANTSHGYWLVCACEALSVSCAAGSAGRCRAYLGVLSVLGGKNVLFVFSRFRAFVVILCLNAAFATLAASGARRCWPCPSSPGESGARFIPCSLCS